MAELNQSHHLPSFRYTSKSTQTWTANGNTHTVTDANVDASSIILIMPTAEPAGRWKITVSAGSFLITSSDSESTSCTFKYVIL